MMRDRSLDFVTSVTQDYTDISNQNPHFFLINFKKELGTMSFKTFNHIFRVMV